MKYSFSRPKKQGLSLGTVIALILTLIAIIASAYVFLRIKSADSLRADARDFVNVLGDAVIGGKTDTAGETAMAALQNIAALTPVVTAVAPTATPVNSRTVSFTFAGTCAFESSVRQATTDAGTGYAPLLSEIKNEITGDVSMITLENVIYPADEYTGGTGDVKAPSGILDALGAAGFDLVLTGHEHALDGGLTGVQSTLNLLRTAGMASTGLRASQTDDAYMQFSISGLNVAVLHYTAAELSSASRRSQSEAECAACLNLFSLDTTLSDIRKVRENGARLVIVSIHWGNQGSNTFTESQREQAQAMADAGADIIIGAHSGVVQPVELLTASRANNQTAQTLVAYSLGALLCDGENGDGIRQGTYIAGALLHVTLTWNAQNNQITFDRLTYTPTYIWRQNMNGTTQYRVIASDMDAPADMITKQRETMEKAYTRIQQILKNSPLSLREKN